MTDQTHGDESQDNVGTGAEISTENDVTTIFYDGSDGAPLSGATPRAPAFSSHSSEAETKASAAAAAATKGFMDTLEELPGGVHQSVPVIALDSPSAAHNRRSSALFPLRADTSPTDAAATPTEAGAAAAVQLEREVYLSELARSQEDIARLKREAEAAETARLHAVAVLTRTAEAAESERVAAVAELAAARIMIVVARTLRRTARRNPRAMNSSDHAAYFLVRTRATVRQLARPR